MKLFIARLIAFVGLLLGAAVAQGAPVVLGTQCDTSWAAPVNGYWGDNTKWTNGSPNGNGACIEVAGTYTVTVGVTAPNITYLIVGGSSGTQTLEIDAGTGGTSLYMNDYAGGNVSQIGIHGRLVLTNLTNSNAAAVFHAPYGGDFDVAHITNNGVIDVIDGMAGPTAQRYLTGNILNNGTINILRNTTMDSNYTTWRNNATLNLGAGKTLTFADTGCGGCRPSFVNGGQITGSGTFLMNNTVHSSNGFFQGNGSIASTARVQLNSSSLHYTGVGAGRIFVRGSGNDLTGNLVSGQELVIEAYDNGVPTDAKISVDQNTTSAGTIRLTHAGTGVGGNAIFDAAHYSQVFTSSGSIISEDGVGGSSSTRSIWGNIANSGTISINRSTSIDRFSSTWTNTGHVNIASGKTLAFKNVSCGGCQPTFVNNAGGSIAGPGALTIDESRNTNNGFFQGGGTIGATASVILHNSALHYTGTGAGRVYVRGTNNELHGNVAAGQELVLQGTHFSPAAAEDAKISAGQNTTSAGIVRISHAGSGANGNAAFEAAHGAGETFTNNGSIIVEDGTGGASSTRSIWGNVVNHGSITINRNTLYNRNSSTLTNTGSVVIASGKMLSVNTANCGGCEPTFANNGGSLSGGGILLMDGIHGNSNGFFQGAGAATAATVVLHNSALHLTGSGPGRFVIRGPNNDLTGNIAVGQEVVVQRVGEDGFINHDDPMSNAGTITLQGTGGNATLRVNGSVLTNTGTVRGIGTVIASTVINSGTFAPGASPGILNVSGNYTQNSSGKLMIEIGGTTVGTQYDRLAVSGAATLAGMLAISTINSFAPATGNTFSVLAYASRVGTFGSTTGVAFASGKQYNVVYGATVTNLVAGTAAVRQPDAHITQGSAAYIGNGIYNTTGASQSKAASKASGTSITYKIKIEHDGSGANDLFLVRGTGTNVAGFTVTYKLGTTNITSQVVAGTFQTSSLAPGASVVIKVKIAVAASAVKKTSVSRLVTLTSVGDGTKKDAVSVTVTRI